MSDLHDDLNKVVNEGSDLTYRFEPEDIEQNKWVCALSYLSVLFFLPLVVCPKSRFGRFHANQSLVLFLAGAVGNLVFRTVKSVLSVVWLGWLGGLAAGVWSLLMVVLMILGIVNVLGGKAKELPLIGKIRLIKD